MRLSYMANYNFFGEENTSAVRIYTDRDAASKLLLVRLLD